MVHALTQQAKPLWRRLRPHTLTVDRVRMAPDSALARLFTEPVFRPAPPPHYRRILAREQATRGLGMQPLWEGYREHNTRGTSRTPDQVMSSHAMAHTYTALVTQTQPETIVEFGTAFGFSGMHFLSGLMRNRAGHLYTFEPNTGWAKAARRNLEAIGTRFTLTEGTFEAQVDAVLPKGKRIDLAFIDAIHTRDFVREQLEIVMERSAPEAIIILDDIDFSDEMRACWQEVAADPRFQASLVLGGHAGVVQKRPGDVS